MATDSHRYMRDAFQQGVIALCDCLHDAFGQEIDGLQFNFKNATRSAIGGDEDWIFRIYGINVETLTMSPGQ